MAKGSKSKPNSANYRLSNGEPIDRLFCRNVPRNDRHLFERMPRHPKCIYQNSWSILAVDKLKPDSIRANLAFNCKTIEHQILTLRDLTQLSRYDYKKRCTFTRQLLTCLLKHHGIIYEGILFGSTVNGLGFKDSDVDLRIRPLKQISENQFEPYTLDDDMVDRTLRNIAFQTTLCSPSIGTFVPSTRCPVAKLTFMREPTPTQFVRYPSNYATLTEGLKYDISLGSETPLGSFNSIFLRFLCYLEPKFHLLATTLRYWSNVHQLIVPGYLSSYALVNMLIYFCQIVEPPLLPTVDMMRECYFKKESSINNSSNPKQNGISCKHPTTDDQRKDNSHLIGLSQIEWSCTICLDKDYYERSKNDETLAVLLLKFFEFYLKFPYTTHIITARPGKALTHEEFANSNQFHPKFPIKPIINIQDPFDLKHNLTSGMSVNHFHQFIDVINQSYERLYNELLNNFTKPLSLASGSNNGVDRQNGRAKEAEDAIDWGLNRLFVKIPNRLHRGQSPDSNQGQETDSNQEKQQQQEHVLPARSKKRRNRNKSARAINGQVKRESSNHN